MCVMYFKSVSFYQSVLCCSKWEFFFHGTFTIQIGLPEGNQLITIIPDIVYESNSNTNETNTETERVIQ